MKNCLTVVLTLIGLLGFICQAMARPIDGNDLLFSCKSPSDSFEMGHCLGYIAALADNQLLLSMEPKANLLVPKFCLTDGVIYSQVKDVVLKWLEDNPAKRNMSGVLVVGIALRQAFPCD